ncbi:MAG: RNA-directed DNA polymerase [Nitrospirae bacterium]|nr:MAG: RNA-directed DNA polymerase [Nitrospirota bacterium]
MRRIEFSEIRNIDDLAKCLSCTNEDLRRLAFDATSAKHCRKMLIPKKNKSGHRIVYKSFDKSLSLIQKNLETTINHNEIFPECVQGFVRKGCIAKNAGKHLAKRYVLNADIEDFFESIGMLQIVNAFKRIGCNDDIAIMLSRLCTLDEQLVQGFSTSPVISNLVCHGMDEDFVTLSKQYNCTYTRYADDMSFSGNAVPTQGDIEDILSNHGFKLNKKKFFLQKRGDKQYVTGLTVFDDKYPRIPKRIKKKLRLTLYYADKYGLLNHFEKIGIDWSFVDWEINKIDGWIAFMFSVEPALAKNFKAKWNIILDEHKKSMSSESGAYNVFPEN